MWYTVIKKYLNFVLVCLGTWTDDAVECYDLDALCADEDSKNKTSMGDLISLIIAPRAILLQIFPYLSFVSVYAMTSSSCPPFIISEKAKKYFPPIFISYDDAKEEAKKRGGGSKSQALCKREAWSGLCV